MIARAEPDPVARTIGDRIRIRRHELGLSQTAVSERVGITKSQLQRYEWGDNRVVVSKLAQLAEALGTTVAWLIGEGDENPISGDALEGLAQRDGPALLAAYAGIAAADDRDMVRRLAEALARRSKGSPTAA